MIQYIKGDLFNVDVEAIVNPVNTVGVMGKGLALEFKKRYPANMTAYAAACRRAEVRTGQMFTTATQTSTGPAWIINFPTKQHWRDSSQLEWVVAGLRDLRRVILAKKIQSIAIPALGAGLGGLFWPDVKQAIEEALADLTGVKVLVFEPI